MSPPYCAHWNGRPTHLGDLFSVSKTRDEKQLHAVCRLWTHACGWEVPLEIDGDLHRSGVCRSQDAVLEALLAELAYNAVVVDGANGRVPAAKQFE